MSSTVGFGVELVRGENFGDMEWELGEKLKGEFIITSSFPEYGDEERSFLLLSSTVVKAGGETTAQAFSPILPADAVERIEAVVAANSIQVVGKPAWFLVDYYTFS